MGQVDQIGGVHYTDNSVARDSMYYVYILCIDGALIEVQNQFQMTVNGLCSCVCERADKSN